MRKKILIMLLVFVFIFLLTACSNGSHQEENVADASENTVENVEGKSHILVAYFTWAENVIPDDIDAMTSASVKSLGNVAQLAQWIGSETGGDLFSIKVTEPYPADWDDCLSRANGEKADGTHPELSETMEDISEYDTIFLEFPI